MTGSIFLTLFLGVFLLIGVVILGAGLHSYFLAKQAADWPTTPGTITTSAFDENYDGDSTTYSVKLSYTYNPDGIERTGTSIAFGYSASSSEKFHREIFAALPAGTQVAVRYDPSKPERTTLTHGVNQAIIFLLIFGGVWTFFTLGMAAMFLIGEHGAGALIDNMIIYSTGR